MESIIHLKEESGFLHIEMASCLLYKYDILLKGSKTIHRRNIYEMTPFKDES